MKGRAEISAEDTREAINLVEAALPTHGPVRDANRLFTKAANAQPFDFARMVETYLVLVSAVSKAVGLGDAIDRFDVESGCYPRALGMMDRAALVEATAKVAQHATKPAEENR